ncbi:MAG: alpha/beta hydrolase [Deltaproteobacteria bacterium]|nr:MAG: alpha/beta hydrolase [Deltaproteobacteria bacterium]
MEVKEGWISTPEQTRLYYYEVGEGDVPVVFCNGIGVSTASFWPRVIQPLSHDHRIIHWDYRGHGYSDPPVDPKGMTIRSCADDLKLLLETLQLDQVVLVGHSMGVQVILEFYKHYREHVVGLVPSLGTYGSPFNNFLNSHHSATGFKLIFEWVKRKPDHIRKIWSLALQDIIAVPFTLWSSRLTKNSGMMIHPDFCPPEELSIYLSHMRRMDPIQFFYLANSMQDHSAEDVLEEIDVPTLIFSGEFDIFTPKRASREMHHRISNSTLVMVNDGSHAAQAERPDVFWKHIDDFLHFHFLEQREEPHKLTSQVA